MSLFYPRFVVNDFAPVFRLMDDLQAVQRPRRCGRFENKLRSFQPRFDVTENGDNYELKGEVPGIDQKNIEITFTDEKTLTIKGHTETHREEGTRPSTQVEGPTEEVKATEAQTEQAPASESETSSYHKASVEDEYVDVASESDATMSGANPDATPAETPKEVAETPKEEAATPAKTERTKRWVSERSSGSFHRIFQFKTRLDRENVSASLKDGILSIVIPKAPAPETKRIEIQ